jgi:hypothetical protein
MSRHELSEPQRRDWRMLTYGAALLAISSTLIYLIYRARHDIPFSWVFLAFGASWKCGRAGTRPTGSQGMSKLLTAAASVRPPRCYLSSFPRFSCCSSRETLGGTKGIAPAPTPVGQLVAA